MSTPSGKLQKRVTRGALTATIQVAAALTRDGRGATSVPKVPQGMTRCVEIHAAFAGEQTLAITENVLTLELAGDGFPGGPHVQTLGSLAGSGTTSGQSQHNTPVAVIPCSIPVTAGGDITANVYADGDTLIVAYVFVTLVFE